MRTYYNEWDEPTAAWLRALGEECHLPSGHVDTRSIRDVQAADLAGYEQCHFFAGIGGWPLALRLAGYEHLPCWTGSPPCQPFSLAGQQRGKDDERHLAPVWLDLVRECRPPVLFGEQVADAIRHGWLDDLFNALEECGYACGAAVLPACSVGAPHIRKRLFFGAVWVGNTPDILRRQCDTGSMGGPQRALSGKARSGYGDASGTSGSTGGLANPNKEQCGRGPDSEKRIPHGQAPKRYESNRFPEPDMPVERLAHSHNARPQRWAGMSERADEQPSGPRGVESGSTNSHNSFWSGADWLGCRDGKFRPVEPGTQPLAHGLPARVGRLRGYGNAIVPQVAATFIKEFLGAAAEIANVN